MGIFNFIKGQFIEVIEWVDNTNNTIVYKFPDQDKEIKMGAQLTVRESQIAVFVNEGNIADIYAPGRYELVTQNMPLLTKLKSWKYGFDSPFKADIYFINSKQFTDQKWGTANPIMMRDKDFGVIRLRGYGIYSFKVVDPVKFLREVFGTKSLFTVEDVNGQLRRMIISGISDYIAESKISAIDLAMHYDELSEGTLKKMSPKFEQFGLIMSTFFIENLSLPEEVEKIIDKKTSMGVMGDLNQYAKFQMADSIDDLAQNDGGNMGNLSMGMAMGNVLGNMLNNQTINNPNQPINNVQTAICPKCNTSIQPGLKFCPNCGNSLQVSTVQCISCNKPIPLNSKFCPECGAQQIKEKICSKCGKKLEPNAKFCPDCGNKIV